MTNSSPARGDVIRLFGTLPDQAVVEILAAEPTMAELEEVAMWLAREDDVMGEARRPLTAVPAGILEMLLRYEEDRGDEQQQPSHGIERLP